MAQHRCFMPKTTNCGSKLVDGENGTSTAVKRRVYFDPLAAKAPKENTHDALRRVIAAGDERDGRDGGRKETPRNSRGHSSFGRPSVESRLRQHVEHFMNVVGGPMVEGRHLLQLLQVR